MKWTRLVCLLLTLILLPGCSSGRQFLFPDDYPSTGGGIYQHPAEKRRLERYEDGHNSAMMRDRRER